jgi:hypothetical protein
MNNRCVLAGYFLVAAILFASCGSGDSPSSETSPGSGAAQGEQLAPRSGHFSISLAPDDETAEEEASVEIKGTFAGLGDRLRLGLTTFTFGVLNGKVFNDAGGLYILRDRALARDGSRFYDLGPAPGQALRVGNAGGSRQARCRELVQSLAVRQLIEKPTRVRSVQVGSQKFLNLTADLDGSAVARVLIDLDERGFCGIDLPFPLPVRQLRDVALEPDRLVKKGRAHLTFDPSGVLRAATARIWIRRGSEAAHDYSYQLYYRLNRVNRINRVRLPEAAAVAGSGSAGLSRNQLEDLETTARGLGELAGILAET